MKLPVVFQDVGLICGNRLWLWGELTFGNEDEMGKGMVDDWQQKESQ